MTLNILLRNDLFLNGRVSMRERLVIEKIKYTSQVLPRSIASSCSGVKAFCSNSHPSFS